MSKAQLFTIDFSIALTISLVLMIALVLSLNIYPVRLNENQNKNEMLITAFQVSNSLIKNPGSPSLWENNLTSLDVIGLAQSELVLSENKVNSFINLDYNNSKNFFGFYDFYFRILDTNNDEIISYGLQFNGTSSISIRRYIIYDNEKAIMELALWE